MGMSSFSPGIAYQASRLGGFKMHAQYLFALTILFLLLGLRNIGASLVPELPRGNISTPGSGSIPHPKVGPFLIGGDMVIIRA